MVTSWVEYTNLDREFARIERDLNAHPSGPLISLENQIDVIILTQTEAIFMNKVWLSQEDVTNLESKSALLQSVLILEQGKVGFYHQTLLDTGKQLFIYFPISQFMTSVFWLSLPILSLLTLLIAGFGLFYTGKMTGVRRSLDALIDIAALGAQLSPSQEKSLTSSNITFPAVEQILTLKKRADAYLESYRGLMILEKSEVSNITKEIVGKWLFSPLKPLNTTSTRFIFPPDSGDKLDSHDAISSLGTIDPYEEFDPLILSISQRTDRLILQDTSQLLKNGVKTVTDLPKSIFMINLVVDGKKFGILWGGYKEQHEFDPDEIELIDSSSANLISILGLNKQFEYESKISNLYQATLNWTPIPIFTVTPAGMIDFANQSAIDLFGIDRLPQEGKQVTKIAGNSVLKQLVTNPQRVEMSVELQLHEDQIFQCAISSLIMDGMANGRVFSFQNVTEIRGLEKQQSDFVNTVSHDLRQPLTSIRGYATMIDMAGGLNSNQVDYLKKISEGVDAMSRMVESLLALGRVEAGIGLQIEIISMRDLVEKINRYYQYLAAQKQISFTVDFDEADIMVRADWSLLEQALRNVIENAIKYSNPGCEVTLSVRENAQELEIKVRDTGIGISPEDQKHVFERFYRGKNEAARSRKGTGLGLSIVKSIVDKHGGEITVESGRNNGTVFTISIPLRQD